jgi:two-component system nitrogen regulation response regulator GlnG
MNQVWIVDDDASIRWVLEKAFQSAGLHARTFADGSNVPERLAREQPDAIITDIRMPGLSGLELMRAIHTTAPNVPVIVMTAHTDLESAVASYQGGAFEYLPKPFDVDEAVALARRAIEQRQDQQIQEGQPTGEVSEIIGEAPAMQEVFRAVGRLANSNINVLIWGESGTGKELVARALHQHSPRGHNPFIAINTVSSRRMAARCSWMKLETCLPNCKPGCCAYYRTAASTGSVDTTRSKCMSVSWQLPTRTSNNAWHRGDSGKTCFIV